LEKPVWGPREAAQKINAAITAGEKPVVMFGPEAAGLDSDEVARADAILAYPTNPGFPSINLANAVALFCFAMGEARQAGEAPEWYRDAVVRRPRKRSSKPFSSISRPSSSAAVSFIRPTRRR